MSTIGRIAHILNYVCKLPHPGPNDIQGPCGCREHEGPIKYSFTDYINKCILDKTLY